MLNLAGEMVLRLLFPGEGHIRPGVAPADIVFILREEPHTFFIRKGNDLIFEANITLRQALNGVEIEVPHLSGETLNIVVNKIIYPGYVHRVPGKGMPVSGTQRTQFGDLVIIFPISFPEHLDNQQRQMIQEALSDKNTVWREPSA
eukprot:TRINITY_DN6198_c0_g1_i1.p1 TRINITY_DN6198_c0_g1~~TRINITY_DN6198_c0_g1_i1.p1  ORF type:complete len:146 (+),score=27.59 TRINITY_DN6198_c0_g1_i1:135-572(+)